MCSVHKASMIFLELLECYNMAKEEHDEEDPRNIQVNEKEGERAVEGPNIEFVAYSQPVKT
jgi:hypothetical protein